MSNEDIAWPNFFLVGAAKCGTVSIYSHLKSHPQVFLPTIKEPNFFTDGPPAGEASFNVPRCGTLEGYKQLYVKGQSSAAIGDASNSYLWDETAAQRIHEVSPHARILISLRDPVERAHSFYLMNLRSGDDPSPTFAEALQKDSTRNRRNWFTSWLYVEGGMYYSQVKRYFETFGRDQVLVLFFDDLVKRPQQTYAAIAQHLSVDPAAFDPAKISEAYNTYRMPRFQSAYRIAGALGLRGKLLPESLRRRLSRNPLLFDRAKPRIDEASKLHLQSIYEPDILRLEELLGRKLPELRKSWI